MWQVVELKSEKFNWKPVSEAQRRYTLITVYRMRRPDSDTAAQADIQNFMLGFTSSTRVAITCTEFIFVFVKSPSSHRAGRRCSGFIGIDRLEAPENNQFCSELNCNAWHLLLAKIGRGHRPGPRQRRLLDHLAEKPQMKKQNIVMENQEPLESQAEENPNSEQSCPEPRHQQSHSELDFAEESFIQFQQSQPPSMSVQQKKIEAQPQAPLEPELPLFPFEPMSDQLFLSDLMPLDPFFDDHWSAEFFVPLDD